MARRKRIILGETYEEKQARKRREAAQRIRVLLVVAVLTVVARIFIKDPVKPPPPVHNVPVKIMPGMLASLPPSERAKLDPQIIARLMLADEQAKQKKQEMLASIQSAQQRPGTYQPPSRVEATEDVEAAKQQLYSYAKRLKAAELEREEFKKQEAAKAAMLVRFANGGNLKVNAASKDNGVVTLRMAGMAATFPKDMVSSVVENAGVWEEPVPANKIKVKPAPGITVIVDRETARRITIKKQAYDEI